jgi:hypothetical protein
MGIFSKIKNQIIVEIDIEKLKQLISRTGAYGNDKVSWLTDFS